MSPPACSDTSQKVDGWRGLGPGDRTKKMRDVEETALNIRGNPLVCVPTWGVVTSLSADQLAANRGASAPGRYYFLLPKRRRRARFTSEKLVTLSAFGPFVTSEAVSFIRTSAMALGLL